MVSCTIGSCASSKIYSRFATSSHWSEDTAKEGRRVSASVRSLAASVRGARLLCVPRNAGLSSQPVSTRMTSYTRPTFIIPHLSANESAGLHSPCGHPQTFYDEMVGQRQGRSRLSGATSMTCEYFMFNLRGVMHDAKSTFDSGSI
jgi:hypothetical protein